MAAATKVTLSKDQPAHGRGADLLCLRARQRYQCRSGLPFAGKNAAGTDVLCALQHGELKDQVVFTCGSDATHRFRATADDEWTHWAFSKNLKVAGGVMAIYRNGQRSRSLQSRAAAPPTAVTALSLGDGFSARCSEPNVGKRCGPAT